MSTSENTFKSQVKNVILNQVLGGSSDSWRVLVLDDFTTKTISSVCKVSDVMNQNISVIEDINKKRQTFRQDAIYFVQPELNALQQIQQDMASNVYTGAHIFFSHKVPTEILDWIKGQPTLVSKLKQLKEAHLEFLTVDDRTFQTMQPTSLRMFFAETAEQNKTYHSALEQCIQRLACVFLVLKEVPAIRYRQNKPPEQGDPPGAMARAILAQSLASKLHDRLAEGFLSAGVSGGDTCELLILDRSFDTVAPVVHEWTYESLLFDLCSKRITGNIIEQTYVTASGTDESRAVALDEDNPLWQELRLEHYADVMQAIPEKLDEFQRRNQLAKQRIGGQASQVKDLVKALPEYKEQLAAISLHSSILDELTKAVNARDLRELSELEEALIYGEQTSKDLITFLQAHPNPLPSDKQRLMATYVATHPEKLDTSRQLQWQKVAGLSPQQMWAVSNLAYLGVAVSKKPGSQSRGRLTFGSRKPGRGVRSEKEGAAEKQKYRTGRFEPLLGDILEEHMAGKLSTDDFPWVRPPTKTARTSRAGAQSVRTGGLGNWAKQGDKGFRSQGSEKQAERKKQLFVYVVGGVTRGEMRVVRQLSQQSSDYDIVLGGTHIIAPEQFVSQLGELSTFDAVQV